MYRNETVAIGAWNGGRIDSSPGLLRPLLEYGTFRLGGWVWGKCRYHCRVWEKASQTEG